MIQITDLEKFYRTEEVQTIALNKLSFQVKQGEFVAIMGPSGCGKSTLLKIISGEAEYDGGQIAAEKALKIGFLKQDIDFDFGKTVLEESYEAFKEIKALENQLEVINTQLAERTDYESESYNQLMIDLNECCETRCHIMNSY